MMTFATDIRQHREPSFKRVETYIWHSKMRLWRPKKRERNTWRAF